MMLLLLAVDAWAGHWGNSESSGGSLAEKLQFMVVLIALAVPLYLAGSALERASIPPPSRNPPEPDRPLGPYVVVRADSVLVVGWPGAGRVSQVRVGIHTLELDGRAVPWTRVRLAERHERAMLLEVDGEATLVIQPVTPEGLDALCAACEQAMQRVASLSPVDRGAQEAVERLRDPGSRRTRT